MPKAITNKLDLHEDGIQSRSIPMRGEKVLMDRDLATLYEVKAIALRQQVRRNPKRFPTDFVFELSELDTGRAITQCDTFAKIFGRFCATGIYRIGNSNAFLGADQRPRD